MVPGPESNWPSMSLISIQNFELKIFVTPTNTPPQKWATA
jgi:hypothetical protein